MADQQYVNAEDLVPGNAQAILISAGLDPAFLTYREGPCPICGGNTRFRWKAPKESGFCNHCRHLGFFDLLKHTLNCDFAEACKFVKKWHGKSGNEASLPRVVRSTNGSWTMSAEEEEKLRVKYRKLWSQGFALEGTAAHQYLMNRVPGLTLNPKTLRFHPALENWEEDDKGVYRKQGVYAGLIAAVQAPDDRVCNIWRTFLTADGHKAPIENAKKAAGKFLAPGGAVRLMEPEGDELGIAEGIENALVAWTRYGVPTWPTLNANGVGGFILPPSYKGRIKKLRIFGDNDAKDKFGRRAGNDAAKKLKERSEADGLRATIILPMGTSYDLADVKS